MRVWIVNPFDNLPDEGYRPQRYWMMSEAFARAGHEVTFWTQDWSHAKKARRTVRQDSGDGFKVRGVHVPGYGRNICLRRIWSHWRFARDWLAAALREEVPDLIVVSSPPLFTGRAVRRFCARAGARYIVDIMDAWPETFERVLPRWMLGWARVVARENYCGAAGVTAVAQLYVDLARSYGAKCPMRLFYHGIALAHECRRMRAADVSDAASKPIRIAYIGNMSLSYDLATAVDAVRSDCGLSLDLAGAGPDEESLRRRAAGCDRIRFHGYLNDVELRAMLESADVGLVPMFDASCVGVPYKLADYVAAGLPVASSLHGETEELLLRHDAGVTYPAGEPEAMRRAVRLALGKGNGALGLSRLFDAPALYKGYVEFAAAL